MSGKIHGSFLSVIVYDGKICAKTASAIIQGYASGLWRGYMFPGGDGISRARNHAAAHFLTKTTCEYHEFIDSDILFSTPGINHLRSHGSRDIVVGIYPAKTEQIRCIYNSLPDGNPEPDENGLMEIAYGGTGFMRIHRRIYERMIEKHPELAYACEIDNDTKWDFFGMGVGNDPVRGTRRYMTEDWQFCMRARALEFRVWADTRIDLNHIGTAVFPLQSEIDRLELAKENAELRAQLAAKQPTTP
jgi:hypothetical protein